MAAPHHNLGGNMPERDLIFFDPAAVARRIQQQQQAENNNVIPARQRNADPDPEMELLIDERDWAIDLKHIFKHREDLSHIQLTDFELTQHAILAEEDTDAALERICRMDLFRRQYGVDDTVEQGVASLRALMEQQPGFSLTVDKCTTQSSLYVHVIDVSKFHPKRITKPPDMSDDERQWGIFMRGTYYLHNSLYPSLSAIRDGVLAIVECEGVEWENFDDEEFLQRWSYEFGQAYPIRFHEISLCHSGVIANIGLNLLRPFVTEETRNKVRMGAQFNGVYDGRLDALFLHPSPEVANERQVATVQRYLQLRERHMKEFAISDHY